MTIIGLFMFLGLMAVGLSMHFKRPLSWLVGVIPWALVTANGMNLSVATWDIYYFAWWAGLAMTIVCVLMALQTRRLDIEEAEIEPKTDDTDNYVVESEEYGDKQRKISKATARRTSGRSRR